MVESLVLIISEQSTVCNHINLFIRLRGNPDNMSEYYPGFTRGDTYNPHWSL